MTLWVAGSRRPVIYDASKIVTDGGQNDVAGLFSSSGVRLSLGDDATPVALWPCSVPVAFYDANGDLWMQKLALPLPPRVPLGRAPVGALFDSYGRWLTTSRRTIHYLHGPTIHLRRLPGRPWEIDWVAQSPSRAGSFLVEVDNPSGCVGTATGRLYLITPSASRLLTKYDFCTEAPLAGWSDDGSRLFWTNGNGRKINIADSSGHSRPLASPPGPLVYLLWSPNGQQIAYTYQGHGTVQVAVVNVASGHIYLTNLRTDGDQRAGQPPEAAAIGWSPSSRTVVIYHAAVNAGRTTIETVPAAGGQAHVVIQLKR